MIKKIIKYFLQGLLFTVPIFITLVVVYQIITTIGSVINYFGIEIHPLIDPFLGFILVIGLVIIIGMLGSSLLFTRIFASFEKKMEGAPLVKIIYSSIKDFLSAFVGQKKRFNKPVLVLVNENPKIEKMGFITQESLEELNLGAEKVGVYLPYSYSFSGQLIIVSRNLVTPLDVNATETMKFIISGGVTDLD